MSRKGVVWGVLGALLAGGLGVATGPASAATAAQDALAKRYAPVLRFHQDEVNWPASPTTFLTSSRVRFAKDQTEDATVASRATAARLSGRSSSGPYRYGYKGRTYTSDQMTRPYATSARPAGLNDSEGFFLEPPTSVRPGVRPTSSGTYSGAPFFYDILPLSTDGRREVLYWFFFAYNENRTTFFDHEGDWEAVGVLLDRNDAPYAARFYGHGCRFERPWSQTRRSGDHVTAYVAKGSHAMYPSPGDGRPPRCDGGASATRDDVAAGRTWNTSAEPVRLVRDEAWFGFGGGWGKPEGRPDHSGPLGPSRYKSRP